jgi:hypothetical protein
MPRILITTHASGTDGARVLLDEHVVTGDLSGGHSAAQLIERIGWALLDADASERPPPGR